MRMPNPLWLLLLLAIMTLISTMANLSYGKWEEVPAHGTTLDFGGLYTDKASSYTAQALHATQHGWIGIQANQITADGESITHALDARTQGGLDMNWASFQFFVEVNRDMETDIAISTGGYIRKTLTIDKLDLVFGTGSFVEREEVRADIGLTETDPTTLPYWIGIASAGYTLTDTVNFYARVIGTPEARFGHWQGTGMIGADVRVAQNAVIRFQSTAELDTRGEELAVDREYTILLSLNY